MASRWRTRNSLINRPDTIGFSVVFVIVIASVLIAVQGGPQPYHRPPVYPAKVLSPMYMAAADRTDALNIVIMRDGTVFFRADKARPDELANAIRQSLKQGTEKKVYIQADARVPYGAIAEVVDSFRDAGIQNIAFIVDQQSRQTP